MNNYIYVIQYICSNIMYNGDNNNNNHMYRYRNDHDHTTSSEVTRLFSDQLGTMQ